MVDKKVMMKPIIMLPTYNEAGHFEGLARDVLSNCPELDMLVIDDSSPDGTGDIADRLAAEFSRVKVMHRPPKSGRGSASLDGYKYAIKNGYDRYLEMDVDGSHSPKELPGILAAASDADLVIGSRFIPGGGVDAWNFQRRMLHRAAALTVKIILGTPNTDHTNGLRCYSVDKLKRINFGRLNVGGYVAHTLLENVYHKAGFRIKEVPSFFAKRRGGESKMSKKEMIGGITAMLKFKWRLIRSGVKYFLKS